MAVSLPGPPLNTPLVEAPGTPGAVPLAGTRPFLDWLFSVTRRAETGGQRVAAITLTGQTASIGTSALVPLASGVYQVSWRLRVSTPASTSSSLQLAIATTEGGVSCLQQTTPYTGNAATRPQSGAFLVHADANTPISYATTYVSVGTPMAYEIDLVVELVN